MTKARLSDVLFWIVAGVALVCFVFFLLLLSGAIATDSATDDEPTARSTQATETDDTAVTAPGTTAAVEPDATTSAAATTTPARKPAQVTTVVLTAARGDCWIQAREGSAEGRVLDERILGEGQSITLESRRIWLALGAAGNLDVSVNGKPYPLTPATTSVLVGGERS